MCGVEIFFGLFQSAFYDVDLSDGEETRKEEYGIIASEFILFLGDKFIDVIMGLFEYSLEYFLFGLINHIG